MNMLYCNRSQSMQKKVNLFAVAIMVALPFIAQPACADELSDLKAQIKILSDRLSGLEAKEAKAAEVQTQTPAPVVPTAQAPVAALTTDQQGVKISPDSTAFILYNNGTSSLSMYGLIEATLSYANHQDANGGTAIGYQTSWFSGNRLGFDFQHALPGVGNALGMPDLKVITKLETEFELPTGNMDTSDVFFNRDAWMGFYSDKLGKLTLGRQNTLTRDFTQSWGDPYGTAGVTLKEGGYSNVNNFKQFIFYSGAATGTRLNSGIVWKKDWDGHWVTGLAYGFGSQGSGGSGDVGDGGGYPGDYAKGSTQEVSVAYNGLALGAAKANANISYDRANNNDLIHQSALVGGNVSYGPFRVNGGFAHYTAQQGAVGAGIPDRTDNSWTVSANYAPGKMDYAMGYVELKGDNAGFNAAGNILNPFGNTTGVTKVANGNKKTVYGSIMFHADKQMDFYIAADYFRVGGDWVLGDVQGNGNQYGSGQVYDGTFEVAVGARFKF